MSEDMKFIKENLDVLKDMIKLHKNACEYCRVKFGHKYTCDGSREKHTYRVCFDCDDTYRFQDYHKVNHLCPKHWKELEATKCDHCNKIGSTYHHHCTSCNREFYMCSPCGNKFIYRNPNSPYYDRYSCKRCP